MPDFISVYMTAASKTEAESIAKALVEEKLAACVNIFPMVNSVYRWQEKVTSATETVLIAKTSASLFPKLETKVKQLSSYECPCVLASPITAGHQPYLDWLSGELK
jgi:periplasmic divalent cation tolerance protein